MYLPNTGSEGSCFLNHAFHAPQSHHFDRPPECTSDHHHTPSIWWTSRNKASDAACAEDHLAGCKRGVEAEANSLEQFLPTCSKPRLVEPSTTRNADTNSQFDGLLFNSTDSNEKVAAPHEEAFPLELVPSDKCSNERSNHPKPIRETTSTEDWHVILKMDFGASPLNLEASSAVVGWQFYTNDGCTLTSEKTCEAKLDERNKLVWETRSGLVYENYPPHAWLHMPCVTQAITVGASIGNRWIMVRHSKDKRFYMAFSIRMGSTSMDEAPICVAPQFSAWVPSVIYHIETQLFAMPPTGQEDSQTTTKGINIDGYTLGEFPGSYAISPLDQCCVHWSRVFQGGSSYLESPVHPQNSSFDGDERINESLDKATESPVLTADYIVDTPGESTLPFKPYKGNLKRALERRAVESKYPNLATTSDEVTKKPRLLYLNSQDRSPAMLYPSDRPSSMQFSPVSSHMQRGSQEQDPSIITVGANRDAYRMDLTTGSLNIRWQLYSADGIKQTTEKSCQLSIDSSGGWVWSGDSVHELLRTPTVTGAITTSPLVGSIWLVTGRRNFKKLFLAFFITDDPSRERWQLVPLATFFQNIMKRIKDFEKVRSDNLYKEQTDSLNISPDPLLKSRRIESSHLLQGRNLYQGSSNLEAPVRAKEIETALRDLWVAITKAKTMPSSLEQLYTMAFGLFKVKTCQALLRKLTREMLKGKDTNKRKQIFKKQIKPPWWPDSVQYKRPSSLNRDDLSTVLSFSFAGPHGYIFPFQALRESWNVSHAKLEDPWPILNRLFIIRQAQLSEYGDKPLEGCIATLYGSSSSFRCFTLKF